MYRRQDAIREKGFAMARRNEQDIYEPAPQLDFGKIRIGLQTLDDAILDLGSFKKANRTYSNKTEILQALGRKDYNKLREISNYYYDVSGIYERLCRYFAFLYRYDWYVATYIEDKSEKNANKALSEYAQILRYLDNSNIKMLFGDVALSVVKNGCYYGYIINTLNGMTLQQLPIGYCRSRFKMGDSPAVEFNMKFFDEKFPDIQYRTRILKMFPDEFTKGYLLYKRNKLQGDYPGDGNGWFLLDPAYAVKFNINGSDSPILANVIPSILDLDAAQELDRKKTMQKLLKVIIQKLPLDKNGDLIFDVDEAKDIHNNAVQMLKRAVGVDVMTTFAEVEVADLADKNTTTSVDDLEKVERTLFNEAGVSHNLFNSDGNIALNSSILNDEASMRNLLLQFQNLLNRVVNKKFPSKKKYSFMVCMLETTVHNYKDMSKMYKEHTQLGFSKMLPQIALGHSQSEILANAYFENEVLDLWEIMVPPMMSSTMSSADVLGQRNQTKKQGEQGDGGRPEKPDNEKSEKTIQNRESAS